ncbi:MAG: PIG-L family deacetylase [Chloroflexi bacterium]|nr:PIG-L family deacetylase [Chloroflexota bacterium]
MTQHRETGRLLAVFAHPDDESFACGGTLAHYANRGFTVTLVCATRGEAGEISDASLATRDNLAEVRERELRNAADALGVTELVLLDYRDSGMAGTPENGHPRAFGNAEPDEVVRELVGIMRRSRPHAVITFDPNGGYGHPDHIAAHNHTTAAFHAAADPEMFPGLGTPWRPARLFYSVFSRGMFDKMKQGLASLGEDVSEFEEWESSSILWEDEDIHAVIDVSGVADAKLKAWNCHQTQFGPDNPMRRVPEDQLSHIIGTETFVLGSPESVDGARYDDLFEGLKLNN